jgi:lipoate-protein ligase A
VNLRKKIPETSMNKFISSMISFFLERDRINKITELSEEEVSAIGSLAESKYRSWEWNYAYGPEYQFDKSFEVDGKPHQCSMAVKDGIIRECRIEGSEMMAVTAEKLIGCRHMPHDLEVMFERRKAIFAAWIF